MLAGTANDLGAVFGVGGCVGAMVGSGVMWLADQRKVTDWGAAGMGVGAIVGAAVGAAVVAGLR